MVIWCQDAEYVWEPFPRQPELISTGTNYDYIMLLLIFLARKQSSSIAVVLLLNSKDF